MTKLQIILGSTRPNRLGNKIMQWAVSQIQDPSISVEPIDLREYPMPFFDEAASLPFLPDGPKNEVARKFEQKVAQADGYLIITPEYNHAPPAVLKNALDYAFKEWQKKPVAFVSYGGSAGGARAVEQLRLIAIELEMIPLRQSVVIPQFWELMDKAGRINLEKYAKPLESVLANLQWWMETMQSVHASQT